MHYEKDRTETEITVFSRYAMWKLLNEWDERYAVFS
jgi:hypothetical protein